MPTMEKGDILGHEPMGEVVEEVGSGVTKLKKGDRVVVPFTIACGELLVLQEDSCSRCCDNVQPATPRSPRKAMGHSPAGLFGYSHMLGGFPGGQAEYLRVPFADVGPLKIEIGPARREGPVPLRHLPDRLHGRRERARSSRATRSPSGAAGRWRSSPSRARGCSAPGRVIAIDRVPERLADGRSSRARPRRSTSTRQDVYDTLQEMTKGRGPDRCIDAVGCEAHAAGSARRGAATR